MKRSREKQLGRLALAIHEQLNPKSEPSVDIEQAVATWICCQNLAGRIQKAIQRDWHQAAQRMRAELAGALNQMRDGLAVVQRHASSQQGQNYVTSANDIYRDLRALETEFVEVSWRLRKQTLSVTTEPIVLEGLDLGPFKIELCCSRLVDGDCFRMIALEPRPAAENENVTHPHVEGEILCEGDARQPIRRALAEGRLLDFFLIVQRTLQTYNPDSPYVKLHDWHDANCSDCGGRMAEQEGTCCGKCETMICWDCSLSCAACDTTFCAECISTCEGCDGSICGACLKSCRACRSLRGPECLTDSMCEACHEKQENQHEAAPTESVAVAP